MKSLIFILAVTCTGEATCNNSQREKTYTITMKGGKTIEACGYQDKWSYPDCLTLYDGSSSEVTRICGVERYEFGIPTPPPPAENPRQ